MKKTLLSIALFAASGTVVAGDYYNGRLTGMSGAGYATGGYADGVVYNPSLGAAFEERDDFALVFNVGAIGEDENELLDGLEDLSDYLNELEQMTAYSFLDEFDNIDPNDPMALEREARRLQQQEAEEAISQLEGVANKTANVGAGTSVVLAIPNDLLSISFITRGQVEASITSVVDEQDYELIRNSIGETDFDPSRLRSYGIAKGALVVEGGLAMAKALTTGEDSQLLLGVTPKFVHVTSFIYSSDVDNFDSDDFEADEYTVETSDYNVDLGATYMSGKMRYALTVSNVMSREYDTIDPTQTLTIKPRPTTALGYEGDWVTTEVAVDLSASPNFATGLDTQYARAGAELNRWDWVKLRAGIQHDLEENTGDTYSAGVGLALFNTLSLDVALIYDSSEEITGGAAQLGLRF